MANVNGNFIEIGSGLLKLFFHMMEVALANKIYFIMCYFCVAAMERWEIELEPKRQSCAFSQHVSEWRLESWSWSGVSTVYYIILLYTILYTIGWLRRLYRSTLCIQLHCGILQQTCLNKWIGSALLGTRIYNVQPLHQPWDVKLPTPKISKFKIFSSE